MSAPSAPRAGLWALVALLVLTNLAWIGVWLFTGVDHAVTTTHMGEAMNQETEALDHALDLLPRLAAPGTSRAAILEASKHRYPAEDSFDKEGHLWVGNLGFAFDEAGQLKAVTRAWSY